ncbi:MAG: ABC transporter substrate-binding protein [Actinomycetota bacterium]|nr:ABC transporter substrate-binding protein [Actinomycetota bacterium]
MKKTLLFLIILLIIITAALYSGCAASGSVKNQDIIRIGDPTGDWGFPSPYGIYPRGPGYIRMSMIFDTLVWKNREGDIIPMLAESWSFDKNKNMFAFKLRDDVSWHDGNSFDAADVVFTFQYIKKHPWIWVDSEVIDSVEMTGTYSVNIYLSEKYAPFLNNIAGTLPILAEHIWEKVDDPINYTGKDAVIGTGPFKLKDYNNSEGTYLFEANKDYYLGRVNIENLAFIKVSEETALAMLENNEIDASSIPPDIVSDIENKFLIEQEPPTWVAKLLINHESNEILKNKEIRQALVQAINKSQIVQISQRGFAVEGSDGLIPPSNTEWYCGEAAKYDFDCSRSKSLIESLGWSMQEDGYYYKDGDIFYLELAVSSGDFERDAQIIKENLKNAGIKVDIITYESKTLDSMVENWNFDIAISGHGGLSGDPESLNRIILGNDFNSVRYFKNKHLINLLNEQIAEMDNAKRKEMLFEIQKIYADELPSITLYYPQWYWAHNDRVKIYYTEGGLATGIPVPINKTAFTDI